MYALAYVQSHCIQVTRWAFFNETEFEIHDTEEESHDILLLFLIILSTFRGKKDVNE